MTSEFFATQGVEIKVKSVGCGVDIQGLRSASVLKLISSLVMSDVGVAGDYIKIII